LIGESLPAGSRDYCTPAPALVTPGQNKYRCCSIFRFPFGGSADGIENGSTGVESAV